ncbi:MAG: D-2-hydroxyacid dehydrogenase [Oscillospiraceae bacterium]|nr:D-2-hydroxyacid dehydrogenase [Oscillospiraceae bacterium]
MKIVILDKNTVTNGDLSFAPIEALGEVTAYDAMAHEKLADAIGDADAVICNKAVLSRDVIENCPKLKYIGLFATGYNNIDIAYARERGIAVCNVPGYSTQSVAQHTFAFILALAGSTCEYTESTRNDGWIKSHTFSYFPFPLIELSGKTLGIFGYGSIGREVAKIGRAFNMNIIVNTRSPEKVTDAEVVARDELFARSDFLTLHAPLTPETEKMVNEKTLSLMKKTAFLINTSRGGAIDEKALAGAINRGQIAGAGLDVLTVEPMASDNPLKSAKNCLITPHIAWAPFETRVRLIDRVAENLAAFANGNPINVVNK